MPFPTTLAEITPAFLSTVLGRSVTHVSRGPIGAGWASEVAALVVEFEDGGRRRLVAKVRRPDVTHIALYTQEVHFYRHVAARLGCVPRMVFGEAHDNGDFLLLLEHIDGHHLRDGFDLQTTRAALEVIALVHGTCWGDRTLQASLPLRVHTPAQAATLAGLVHGSWDEVTTRFPVPFPDAPTLDGLAAAVARLEPTTLTHNDLHAENVLVAGGRIVLVDWQNATWSTPMVDVANLIAGCAHPDVQRAHWRELIGHYTSALERAGGPSLDNAVTDYATGVALLLGWVTRYLATVSDHEASTRPMLLGHWERVCTGFALTVGLRG